MSRPKRFVSLVLALFLSPKLVVAQTVDAVASVVDMPLRGEVVGRESRWSSDGRRIVSDVTVRDGAGELWTLTEPGGRLPEGGMFIVGGPPLFELGDTIDVRMRSTRDLSGNAHWVVVERISVQHALDRFAEASPLGYSYAPTLSTETHERVYWDSGCAYVTYDATGTPDLEGDTEFSVMDAVFEHWQSSMESCSYFRFVLQGKRDAEVEIDGENVIKFRDDEWCTPATEDTPAECHPHGAIGLTKVTYRTNGEYVNEIVDVDIELNGVDNTFGADAATADTTTCTFSLRSVLTHEVGHLLGLAHTCLMPDDDPATLDGDGVALLPCSDPRVTAEMREATMFGESPPCSNDDMASLTPDDIAGVCALMPLEADPGTCDQTTLMRRSTSASGCACAAATTSDDVTPVLSWLAFGSLLGVSRRRSTRVHPRGAARPGPVRETAKGG